MRKLSALFASLALVVSVISAQKIGITIGTNTANVRVTGVSSTINPNTSFKTGYTVGLFTELDMGKNFSFRPELNYTQKGFQVGVGTSIDMGIIDLPIGANVMTNVNYIETPLLLQYKLSSGKLSTYALAGPTLGYALNGTYAGRVKALINLNVYENDINLSSSMANRLELGAQVGGGLSYDLGTVQLHGGVRYAHGFTSAIGNTFVDAGIKNSGIVTNVGVSIPIGYRD